MEDVFYFISNLIGSTFDLILVILAFGADLWEFLQIEFMIIYYFLYLIYKTFKSGVIHQTLLYKVNLLSFSIFKYFNFNGMWKYAYSFSIASLIISIIISYFYFNIVHNSQSNWTSTKKSYYQITTSSLNGRSGPGKGYKIIKKLNEGDALDLVDDSGYWYKMKDSNGKEFFVSKEFLTKIPELTSKSSIDYRPFKNEIFIYFILLFWLQNSGFLLLFIKKEKCYKCKNIFSFNNVNNDKSFKAAFSIGDPNGKECDCLEGWLTCPSCNGDRDCSKCHGHGSLICGECKGSMRCRQCAGQGKVDCPSCKGSGTRDRRVTENGISYTKTERCYCGGSGHMKCSSCRASGTCTNCKKGEVVCSMCYGAGKCVKCTGKGKVICGKCDGVSTYSINNFVDNNFKHSFVGCKYCDNITSESISIQCVSCQNSIAMLSALNTEGKKVANYTKDGNYLNESCSCNKQILLKLNPSVNEILKKYEV